MLQIGDLRILETSDLTPQISIRSGETKIGQIVRTFDRKNLGDSTESIIHALKAEAAKGVRFVILGIPEDIGPLANQGRAGARNAWQAFLQQFLNVQHNNFCPTHQILLLGEVILEDLQAHADQADPKIDSGVQTLRTCCGQLDTRVKKTIELIAAAGLQAIVVGGGHNNSLPILQGFSCTFKQQFACINCDAHLDFRELEGRHSGNAFSYAHAAGLLNSYFVLGIHEGYNSEEMLARFTQSGYKYISYEDIKIRQTLSWTDAILAGIEYLRKSSPQIRIAMELDLDSIAYLPASAFTPNGISSEEAAQYVHNVAVAFDRIDYLHIAEGAPLPAIQPSSIAAPELDALSQATLMREKRSIGRIITSSILAFIKAQSK